MFIKLSSSIVELSIMQSSSPRKQKEQGIVASIVLMIGLCAVAPIGEAQNNPTPEARAIAFNIPSEPLANAIQAFSQASGIEVFYESRIAIGRTSPALQGSLTPADALQALLVGTGFVVRYNKWNAISLSVPADESDLPPPHPLAKASLSLDTLHVLATAESASQSELQEFSEVVQSEVETVLRKNAKINSGNYRVRVKLWVDPSRTIRRAEVVQTTGDAERDVAIAQALQGFVISRAPPPNAPQPIRVIVSVRSL